MKAWSAGIIRTTVACACMMGLGFELSAGEVLSQNVTGYAKASLVTGTVVRSSRPNVSSTVDVQKEHVELKGVFYSSMWCTQDAGESVFPESSGTVEELRIGGMSLVLVQKRFVDGCIVTKDYGSFPVVFSQRQVGTNTFHRCVLTINDEQLAQLRKESAQDSKREVQQSK